jgi:hypothetical protein
VHTDWHPPTAYPVALVDDVVYIPDFRHSIPACTFQDVKQYIHADLRRRRLERQAQPFASSPASVLKMYPKAVIIIIPTEGWENPGPLAVEAEE